MTHVEHHVVKNLPLYRFSNSPRSAKTQLFFRLYWLTGGVSVASVTYTDWVSAAGV